MSKQIYVDSNGNETEYGGSVNYGSILPMSPSDDTPVAEAIETLQTNKQDKLTTSTGTITAGTNVTLVRPLTVKYGNLKMISTVFKVTGSTSIVGTLPSGYAPTNTIDFSCVGDSGHGCRLQIVSGKLTIQIASAPTQDEYYAINICYV